MEATKTKSDGDNGAYNEPMEEWKAIDTLVRQILRAKTKWQNSQITSTE